MVELTTTDELPCWRHWTRYAASEGVISLVGDAVDMLDIGDDGDDVCWVVQMMGA